MRSCLKIWKETKRRTHTNTRLIRKFYQDGRLVHRPSKSASSRISANCSARIRSRMKNKRLQFPWRSPYWSKKMLQQPIKLPLSSHCWSLTWKTLLKLPSVFRLLIKMWNLLCLSITLFSSQIMRSECRMIQTKMNLLRKAQLPL